MTFSAADAGEKLLPGAAVFITAAPSIFRATPHVLSVNDTRDPDVVFSVEVTVKPAEPARFIAVSGVGSQIAQVGQAPPVAVYRVLDRFDNRVPDRLVLGEVFLRRPIVTASARPPEGPPPDGGVPPEILPPPTVTFELVFKFSRTSLTDFAGEASLELPPFAHPAVFEVKASVPGTMLAPISRRIFVIPPSEAFALIRAAEGGTIAVEDPASPLVGTSLAIPPDALAEDTAVFITRIGELPAPLPAGLISMGPGAFLGYPFVFFRKPALLQAPFRSGEMLNLSIPPISVRVGIFDFSRGEWRLERPSRVFPLLGLLELPVRGLGPPPPVPPVEDLVFVPVAQIVDVEKSFVRVEPAEVIADGRQVARVLVEPRDLGGRPMGTGHNVQIAVGPPGAMPGQPGEQAPPGGPPPREFVPARDLGDGRYEATVGPRRIAARFTVTARVNGQLMVQRPTITFAPRIVATDPPDAVQVGATLTVFADGIGPEVAGQTVVRLDGLTLTLLEVMLGSLRVTIPTDAPFGARTLAVDVAGIASAVFAIEILTPEGLSIVSGDGQIGLVGSVLPEPIVVLLVDPGTGRPVPAGIAVIEFHLPVGATFTSGPVAAGGSLSVDRRFAKIPTDANGRASSPKIQLGFTAGEIPVTAKNSGFTATALLRAVATPEELKAPPPLSAGPAVRFQIVTPRVLPTDGTGVFAVTLIARDANGRIAQNFFGQVLLKALDASGRVTDELVVEFRETDRGVRTVLFRIALGAQRLLAEAALPELGLIIRGELDIDLVPPTIAVLSPVEGQLFTTASVFVTATIVDLGFGVDPVQVKLTVDDQPASFQLVNGQLSAVLALPDGLHRLEISALDRAGNRSERQVNFTTDTLPPAVTVGLAAGSVITGPATVEVTTEDAAGLDISTFRAALDGVDITAKALLVERVTRSPIDVRLRFLVAVTAADLRNAISVTGKNAVTFQVEIADVSGRSQQVRTDFSLSSSFFTELVPNIFMVRASKTELNYVVDRCYPHPIILTVLDAKTLAPAEGVEVDFELSGGFVVADRLISDSSGALSFEYVFPREAGANTIKILLPDGILKEPVLITANGLLPRLFHLSVADTVIPNEVLAGLSVFLDAPGIDPDVPIPSFAGTEVRFQLSGGRVTTDRATISFTVPFLPFGTAFEASAFLPEFPDVPPISAALTARKEQFSFAGMKISGLIQGHAQIGAAVATLDLTPALDALKTLVPPGARIITATAFAELLVGSPFVSVLGSLVDPELGRLVSGAPVFRTPLTLKLSPPIGLAAAICFRGGAFLVFELEDPPGSGHFTSFPLIRFVEEELNIAAFGVPFDMSVVSAATGQPVKAVLPLPPESGGLAFGVPAENFYEVRADPRAATVTAFDRCGRPMFRPRDIVIPATPTTAERRFSFALTTAVVFGKPLVFLDSVLPEGTDPNALLFQPIHVDPLGKVQITTSSQTMTLPIAGIRAGNFGTPSFGIVKSLDQQIELVVEQPGTAFAVEVDDGRDDTLDAKTISSSLFTPTSRGARSVRIADLFQLGTNRITVTSTEATMVSNLMVYKDPSQPVTGNRPPDQILTDPETGVSFADGAAILNMDLDAGDAAYTRILRMKPMKPVGLIREMATVHVKSPVSLSLKELLDLEFVPGKDPAVAATSPDFLLTFLGSSESFPPVLLDAGSFNAGTGGFAQGDLRLTKHHFAMRTFAAHRLVEQFPLPKLEDRPSIAILDSGIGDGNLDQELDPALDLPLASGRIVRPTLTDGTQLPGEFEFARLGPFLLPSRRRTIADIPDEAARGGHGHAIAMLAAGIGASPKPGADSGVLGIGKDILVRPIKMGPGKIFLDKIVASSEQTSLFLASQDPAVVAVNMSYGLAEGVIVDMERRGHSVAEIEGRIAIFNTKYELMMNRHWVKILQAGKILVTGAGNRSTFSADLAAPQNQGGNRNKPRIQRQLFETGLEFAPNLFVTVGGTRFANDPEGPEVGAATSTGLSVSVSAPADGVPLGLSNGLTIEFENDTTSLSAAIVSGLVAEMVLLDQVVAPGAARNRLTPSQIVELLEATTDDLGAIGPDDAFGHGRINTWKALLSIVNGGTATDKRPQFTTLTPIPDENTQWYGFEMRSAVQNAKVFLDNLPLEDKSNTLSPQVATFKGVRNESVVPSGPVPGQQFLTNFSIPRADLLKAATIRLRGPDGKEIFSIETSKLLTPDRGVQQTFDGVALEFDDFVFTLTQK